VSNDELMMMMVFLESQSTVSAGMCTRLVQVDVDFGMSKMFITARASNNALVGFDDWLFGDQVNCPVLVDDFGSVHEAHISVIVFVISLK
jgi:hypothetical protein